MLGVSKSQLAVLFLGEGYIPMRQATTNQPQRRGRPTSASFSDTTNLLVDSDSRSISLFECSFERFIGIQNAIGALSPPDSG